MPERLSLDLLDDFKLLKGPHVPVLSHSYRQFLAYGVTIAVESLDDSAMSLMSFSTARVWLITNHTFDYSSQQVAVALGIRVQSLPRVTAELARSSAIAAAI